MDFLRGLVKPEWESVLLVLLAMLGFRLLSDWLHVAVRKARKYSEEDATVAVYRIVGCIHHTIQVPLALYILAQPQFRQDRVGAHSAASRALLVISSGYFIHDFFHALSHLDVQGWGYVIHGIGCTAVYGISLVMGDVTRAPRFHFYGAGFMLWELSSYFLHFRWFMFKHNTSKRLQLYNGLALIASYLLCRLVWGFYLSYLFVQDSKSLDLAPAYLYMMWGANVALNSLNVFWFSLIIKKAIDTLSGRHSFGKRD
uniref:TLC domain-containing protein n=1 Tax=Chlamydomonas leiostraca TaxID=1034604 RepID=A0A7S0S185_9CHLO|mmetsp:Transcript_37357/g.94229  ORF Transcript_37357/g.94229 Transcript_37357/m.94229 type:complete len:256 (+) Transcript_37357:88-855(+)|eukprot:CAMPEP_0202867046 /NCGR_PEP_ID=MMETSP1391-20130828/8573_1 /ASSEMBLY_ACC=CAM_ASM_000867 /TAXON_ID=1034604 /ORGANISM="Chlamydomonas leiostraca, Strain SAG 11-49" /LENGTH=255 /DNA_ID=CAMNT_0049547049 /DNA_START=88 /DNA_END=855 /DNA_ORIENTATION=-